MPVNVENIKVSKHAKDRFRQRYGLFLSSGEKKNIHSTLLGFLSSSHKNVRLDQCPFYKNKLNNCDVYLNGSLKFYLKNHTVITVAFNRKRDWRF